MEASGHRRRGSSAAAKASWRATYDGTSYEEHPWFEPGPSRTVREAVHEKFLPPGATVLDVGCGAGSNVLYLGRNGFSACGVDLSPAAVKVAQSRAAAEKLPVVVSVGDALALDFPRAKFSAALDHGCFHTLPIHRRDDYAREISRVLQPGAAFLLSWVAREHTGQRGPPHRPSLEEVTRVFERYFQFQRTIFRPPEEKDGISVYDAWTIRRKTPQPPRR